MRGLQYFSDEYLARCREMRPEEILDFLESFRTLRDQPSKSRLISMKVPENLPDAFKRRCSLNNVPYQRQIKSLMKQWLLENSDKK